MIGISISKGDTHATRIRICNRRNTWIVVLGYCMGGGMKPLVIITAGFIIAGAWGALITIDPIGKLAAWSYENGY